MMAILVLCFSYSVENQPSFHSLKQFFRVLGQKDFLELANHVLKGDQVIVRGCDVTTVTSIISILKVCSSPTPKPLPSPSLCCHTNLRLDSA